MIKINGCKNRDVSIEWLTAGEDHPLPIRHTKSQLGRLDKQKMENRIKGEGLKDTHFTSRQGL
jgi:hypothetical protein